MKFEALGWPDVGIALSLVGVALVLGRLERVGYTKVFLIGTLRAIAQLVAIGYVLRLVFGVAAWWLNLVVLLVMAGVATFNAVRRQDHPTPGYARIAGIAMLVGPFTVLAVVILLVIRVSPWFKAQYLIPLGGMIIAYAMNSVTLFKNRFDAELRTRRAEIEVKLALGATASRAAETTLRAAYRAALLPTVNMMMVVGLVQIPGMMGGQIIGGVDPLNAARYQMMVTFQLAGAAMLSCFVVARLSFRLTFTRTHQLAA